ncbi:BLUF domain-containing protein [Acinetobacter larvae]|uniref:Blue light sensor protein n=1 Tax=Acinetobacter larvae TaxID=1789224 RepID=A0A1B2M016_9GAMM|nr:BLUF domain-containing protein [Acinetobacter larvae]AOA58509.1 blue light sensor protein [Acinetobacter larvae]
MGLVRLLYASTISDAQSDVYSQLFDILNSSVRFNSRQEVSGVLYYGYGYFTQCIEGEKSTIENLYYNRILKDPRHYNCQLLHYAPCEEKLFKQWSMKFAPINKKIIDFFQQRHMINFDPYQLTTQNVQQFIEILANQPACHIEDYHETI